MAPPDQRPPAKATIAERINPARRRQLVLLRVAGTLLTLVGGGLMITAFVSFFTAFGGGEPPRLFWCAFVGMPTFAIGVYCLGLGFLGSGTRFIAGETVPVAVDAIDAAADRVAPAVRRALDGGAGGVELRLARLERLRGDGAIADDEYRAQRARILAEL